MGLLGSQSVGHGAYVPSASTQEKGQEKESPHSREQRFRLRETMQQAVEEVLQTHRGRVRLAISMEVPLRCGGRDYLNGEARTMIGGQWLTDPQLEALKQRIREDNARALRELDTLTDEELVQRYPYVQPRRIRCI